MLQIKFSIDLGHGVMPSGNRPLLKAMLSLIYVAIWHRNELVSY